MSLRCSRQILFLFFFGISYSCRNTSTGNLKEIIGKDDRVPLMSSNHASRVGVILGPTQKCNASLIGENVAVTALHCIPKNREATFVFLSADNSFESKVVSIKEEDKNSDLIFLYLADKTRNFFEIASKDEIRKSAILVYDTQSGLVTDLTNCTLKSSGRIFYHTCDTIPGYSGAPFIFDDKIVGIHLGHDFSERKNLGVSLVSKENGNIGERIFVPEVVCGTDCYTHCRRKILGKWVANLICESACITERQVDCSRIEELEICGEKFQVPLVAYAACKAAIALLPTACTVGTATSAGAACGLNIGLATSVCVMPVAVANKILVACTSGK